MDNLLNQSLAYTFVLLSSMEYQDFLVALADTHPYQCFCALRLSTIDRSSSISTLTKWPWKRGSFKFQDCCRILSTTIWHWLEIQRTGWLGSIQPQRCSRGIILTLFNHTFCILSHPIWLKRSSAVLSDATSFLHLAPTFRWMLDRNSTFHRLVWAGERWYSKPVQQVSCALWVPPKRSRALRNCCVCVTCFL